MYLFRPDSFIIAKDGETFQHLTIRIFTWTTGNLPDGGGTIKILDKDGLVVDEVIYGISQGWSYWPAGNGPSLELFNPNLDNSRAVSWRSSYYINGTPGKANTQAPVVGLFLNEVMARNASYYPTEDGVYTDWLEIFNARSHFVNLNDLYITKYADQPGYFRLQISNPDEAMIPPGGFKTLWLDKETQKGPLHANFDVPGAGSFLGLYRSEGGQFVMLDSFTYSSLGADQSYGRLPDGGPGLQILGIPSPNAPNRLPKEKVVGVYINEVLARNSHTYLNNLGEYDDWLELYNSTNSPVDVGGLYLTDKSDNLTLYQIPPTYPDSTTITAKGFLLFFPTNKVRGGIQHLGFQLAGGGEFVALTQMYQGNLVMVDSLSYPAITSDLSYGRQYDGSHVLVRFSSPTPGSSNNGTSATDPSELDRMGLTLYPNPVRDQLNIFIPATTDPSDRVEVIEIRSLFGKVVERWVLSSRDPFAPTTLQWNIGVGNPISGGIYFVIIQRGRSVLTRRIIIE